MKYRTTRAVRFAGRAYADNDPIPHPDDLPGTAALFDKVRGELVDMGAIVLDVDTVESLADRRNDLVRQLADAIGIAPGRLMVLPSPETAGDYALRLDERGNWEIIPFAAINPLAGADDATIRRHHLDALRALDDLTYLALADDVAVAIGEMAVFTVDADTGVVVAVAPRAPAPIVPSEVGAPGVGAGDAVQSPDAVDTDGQTLAPDVPAPIAEQATESPVAKTRGARKPKADAE